MPKISVIIPLYNKSRYIGRAVQSVLNQTFCDFELIVVDDGSTDDGPMIVQAFGDNRIRMVSQNNSGVSAARNRGIRESKTELIAFLDADDMWLETFLQCIFELIEIYPQAGAYATAYAIDKGNGITQDIIKKIYNAHDEQIGLLDYLYDQGLHVSAVSIKKSVLQKTGGFRVGYTMAEDCDLFMRISTYYPIAYQRTVCSTWFYSINDSATKTNLPNFPSPVFASWDDIISDKSVTQSKKNAARKYIINRIISDIMKFITAGEKEVGLKALKHAKSKIGLNYKFFACFAMLTLPTAFFRLHRDLRLKLVRRYLYYKARMKERFQQNCS